MPTSRTAGARAFDGARAIFASVSLRRSSASATAARFSTPGDGGGRRLRSTAVSSRSAGFSCVGSSAVFSSDAAMAARLAARLRRPMMSVISSAVSSPVASSASRAALSKGCFATSAADG